MISDGEECPIDLWWPVFSSSFLDSHLSIKELDEPANCIAKKLNISRESFVGKGSSCPADFTWRGKWNSTKFYATSQEGVGMSLCSSLAEPEFLLYCNNLLFYAGSRVAPSSNFLRVSFVPLEWLVCIALLVLIGEVIAVVLLILNIAMRKNK